MIFKGTILKYDKAEATGILMLSNGKQQKFTNDDWIETNNTPTINQKVSYENEQSPMGIKSIIQAPISQPSKKKEKEDSPKEFTNLDECLEYFTKKNYKVIRDMQDNDTRTLILRYFSEDSHGEATVKQIGDKISVTQTLNGKKVL